MRRTIGLLLAACTLPAQDAPAGRPAFEVASLKRASPASGPAKGDPDPVVSIAGGNLTMRNVTLKDMLGVAYGLKDHQLAGPGWLGSDRFDVAAKSAAATGDQVRLMLQGLLAERFKLETHRETRDLAVAEMVAGKNGARLSKAKPEGPAAIGIDNGRMTFANYSMARLAGYLSRSAPQPVVDATNIDGFYDFSVRVLDTPSDNLGDVKRAIGMATRDGSLTRMVVEELGLRLETRKGPVEVLVVDRAERSPIEN